MRNIAGKKTQCSESVFYAICIEDHAILYTEIIASSVGARINVC